MLPHLTGSFLSHTYIFFLLGTKGFEPLTTHLEGGCSRPTELNFLKEIAEPTGFEPANHTP